METRQYACRFFAFCLATSCLVAVSRADERGSATAQEIESAFAELVALKHGLGPEEARGIPQHSPGEVPDQQNALNLADIDFIELVRDELGLNNQHLEQLSRDGVILRRTQSDFSFPAAYYSIYVRDLPLLITSDSILHAVHRSFDEILNETEATMIRPVLNAMLDRVHSAIAEVKEDGIDPALEASLSDVDVYLSTARNLLAGRTTSRRGILKPHIVEASLVEGIVDKTNEANEIAKLQIYGTERQIDFTQFKPRGRYAGYYLQSYFRAMSWLGRSDCGWRVDSRDEFGERELQSAVLLCLLLQRADCVDNLNRIDSFLTEFIGQPNGVSASGMIGLMNEIAINDIEDCADREKIQQLSARLRHDYEPRMTVRSEVVDSEKSESRIRFQLFAQRFAIDAFLLSKLTFNAIEIDGQKPMRMLPKGLDVMASFGNPLAQELLRPELERWKYWDNLGAAQALVDKLDKSYWEQSFYTSWLNSLPYLHATFQDDDAVPTALRSTRWQLKQLQAQLASWAELRRDTMLYVAQTYSPPGCEYPSAYVEPYPEFFASLSELMRRTAAHQRKLQSVESAKNFRGFHRALGKQLAFLEEASGLLDRLEIIARKELKLDPLSVEEEQFLQKTISRQGNTLFGSAFVNGVDFDGWYTKLIYGFKGDGESGKIQDDFHPVIADVHTSPSDEEVLQIGTGRTDLCVLVVDQGSDCGCVYVGPAYSYYEFVQPMTQRLSGPEWRKMLDSPQSEYKRPTWMDSLLTSGVAPHKPIGQTAVARNGKEWIVTHPGGKYGGHAKTQIRISDQGLVKLVRLAPETRWLDLSESPISDSGLEQLKELRDVRAVNLQGTSITDSGVASLANFKYMRVLNLSDTDISNSAMDVIASWTYLSHLELANTAVDDSSILGLRGMRYLRHLDLRGTQVTHATIRELERDLPKATILRD